MSPRHEDGTYPRPQLRRARWVALDGVWDFADDPDDTGRAQRWFGTTAAEHFDRQIVVPFPPESAASKIGDTGLHPVVWYRRTIEGGTLRDPRAPTGSRVLVHFGAVDFAADVWFDGVHVGAHAGGQSPFRVDVTDLVTDSRSDAPHTLVVRAEDDPVDASQPRGKQTWQPRPAKVWYDRTTGIWQTVWSETVPATRVAELWWRTEPHADVSVDVELAGPVAAGTTITVTLQLAGRHLGRASTELSGRRGRVRIPMSAVSNGVDREDVVWTPEHPVLLDAVITVADRDGAVLDTVESYVGIRTVGVGGGRFLLNGRPYQLRAVLNQGFRESTLLANTGTEQLREEVELAKAMGFNAMRIHQKAEDPRILYWADRLGLLVWGEIGATYEFTSTAVERLTTEWVALVRRDRSHPSLVAWVPVNESWGVPDLASDPAQRAFAAGIAQLTRALDPTRPVMSNEGWEHVDSDVLGVHDYSSDPAELARHLRATAPATLGLPTDLAAGRVVALTEHQLARYAAGDAPLLLTEFGGLSLRSDVDDFTYHHVDDTAALQTLLAALFDTVRAAEHVAGFCYTQLFDTAQERNGLADATGRPKLPVGTVHQIVTGTTAG